jgi:hypothetical protein
MQGTISAAAAGLHRQKARAPRFSIFRCAIAIDREAPTLLLAALLERSYNTQIALCVPANTRMDKFEEFGKRIDEELTRLRRYLEEEVAPETEKRTAQFLREVSAKLDSAATKLEARNAARRTQSEAPKT